MSQGFDLILNSAFNAHQAGNVEQAKRLFEQAYRIQPNHFGLLMLFSAFAAEQGLSEKVIELLKKH